MASVDWNDRYVTGDLPWDTGEPDEYLVDFVGSGEVAAGRALDVGCGTGTNALWLARQGFDVVGVDLASAAIDSARARHEGSGLPCRFERLDVLAGGLPGGPFDLVFDRGCFHVFDDAPDRAVFAARIAEVLAPGGRWLSLVGSTEGPPREHGPPRRSARDIAEALEPALELLSLRAVMFRANTPRQARAWWVVAGARSEPAQPSTRR